MQEIWVQSLGQEDPLEQEMAIHSSILAWGIPMDRGTWRATAHEVTKSQTQLSTHAHIFPHTNKLLSFISETASYLPVTFKNKKNKHCHFQEGLLSVGLALKRTPIRKGKMVLWSVELSGQECSGVQLESPGQKLVNYDNFWFQSSTLLLKSKLACHPMILTWFCGFLILT